MTGQEVEEKKQIQQEREGGQREVDGEESIVGDCARRSFLK